ncbi:MAG: alpha-E domain-containing protein [Pseudomonadota bacterium]
MLARVAENLYWMGRQLERAENTARLVDAITQVLLDSPAGIELGWDQLIRVMGRSGVEGATEAQVVHWLLLDEHHPGSVVMSLRQARENARSLREVLPREVWEKINGLHLRAPQLMASALERSRRNAALRDVVDGRLMISGRLAETMSHDAAFHFIRLGELLERADMTSRIVDISSAVACSAPGGLGMETTWISILKALSGFQMYRRHEDVRISPRRVVSFLFTDQRFPRAIRYCLDELENTLAELPDPGDVLMAARQTARLLPTVRQSMTVDDGLPVLIDAVQQRLGAIHDAVSEGYFHLRSDGACLQDSGRGGAAVDVAVQ